MSPTASSPNRRAVIALALILFISAALRIWLIADKNSLEYDEAISYLEIACRQKQYSAESFTAVPQPTAYWKTYFEVERPFCFSEISADLARTDIHPPLYFWLLHVWSLIWGIHLWTGPTLNVIITLFTSLALYRLACLVWKNNRDALLVVFTFAFSPSVILISQEARPYDLLALWAALLAGQTIIAIQNDPVWTRKQAFLLALTVAAGMLTHYDFAIAAAGSAMLTFLTQIKHDRRRVTAVWGALFIGGILAFILHPHLFASAQTVAGRAPMFTWPAMAQRVQKIGSILVGFAYLLIPLLMLPIFKLTSRQQFKPTNNTAHYYPIFFLLWSAGIIFLRYLAFLTPAHAMWSPKYLSLVWPFLAFVPSLLRQAMPQWRTLSLYLYAIPLLMGGMLPLLIGTMRPTDPESILAPYELVIIDNAGRGNVMPIIWQLPNDSQVIVTNQDKLQEQISIAWLPSGQDALWVHELADNAPDKHESLLQAMNEVGYVVQQLQDNLSSLTTAHELYLVTQ